MRVPYFTPDIGEEEIREVVDTLRAGWVTTGPKSKAFENAMCSFLGGEVETIAVSSATAGLHLALEALGVGPGDEVIVPVFTFTATAEVVVYLGATPVFVDVDEVDLNITLANIEEKVSPRTKAVIVVHFAGKACDMTAIQPYCKAHGIKLIEDAAHALPATCNGRLIGTLDSDATVFSFYANKTMTSGEGGMVITKNPQVASRCRVMRLHGIDRDSFDRYTSDKPKWFYEIVAPGYKYNLSDIHASLGIVQLKRLKGFQNRRSLIANEYLSRFSHLNITLPANVPLGEVHAWHLFTIRLPSDVDRNGFIEDLSSEGVGTSVHFIPLNRHPYWKNSFNLTDEMFPIATRAYEKVVSLPIFTLMSPEQLDIVVDSVTGALNG